MTATADASPDVTLSPAVPCEHRDHSTQHTPPDEPAKYYVLVECRGCGGAARYHLCEPGLNLMASEDVVLVCRNCGAVEPWHECLWVLKVL